MVIGSDKVFIIAELSANHGNSLVTAIKTVQAAKECGADAIKVQTYTADTITIDSDKEWFRINQGTVWDGVTLYQLYKEASFPWEWHKIIQEEATRIGLIFFSTPFDHTSVDFLESLSVPIYKIASFELNDIPLIERVASKGKPVIMSTGIASLAEIEEAVDTCRKVGNRDIILLKCTSQYPASPEEINLRTIPHMAELFGVPVGLSDHTIGEAVPVAAVALGASVIEKHFILDKKIGGPDASFSMEPNEFKHMVESIRIAFKALGKVNYKLSSKETKSRDFSRSLFVCEDIHSGDVFTEGNIRSIRPGFGMHTRYYKDIIGKKATGNISKGTPLAMKHVFWE